MTRAIFQYARGALVEAEADGRAALEALPHRNVWFRPTTHGWLAQILVERGSIDEAAELLDAVEASVAPDAFSRAPLLRARALVAAARGDHHAALEHALELGRGADLLRPHQPARLLPGLALARSARAPRARRDAGGARDGARKRSSSHAPGEHRARSAAPFGSSA